MENVQGAEARPDRMPEAAAGCPAPSVTRISAPSTPQRCPRGVGCRSWSSTGPWPWRGETDRPSCWAGPRRTRSAARRRRRRNHRRSRLPGTSKAPGFTAQARAALERDVAAVPSPTLQPSPSASDAVTIGVHTLGLPTHVLAGLDRAGVEQPSPDTGLPSSHSSPGATTPSPQAGPVPTERTGGAVRAEAVAHRRKPTTELPVAQAFPANGRTGLMPAVLAVRALRGAVGAGGSFKSALSGGTVSAGGTGRPRRSSRASRSWCAGHRGGTRSTSKLVRATPDRDSAGHRQPGDRPRSRSLVPARASDNFAGSSCRWTARRRTPVRRTGTTSLRGCWRNRWLPRGRQPEHQDRGYDRENPHAQLLLGTIGQRPPTASIRTRGSVEDWPNASTRKQPAAGQGARCGRER